MARRLSRRTVIRGGAVGASLAGLAAIGCGGSSNTNKNSGGSPASQAASAGTAAANTSPAAGAAANAAPTASSTIKTGGTIQEYIVGTTALDPFENSTFRTQYLAGFTYSRLFCFNSGADPTVTLSRQPVPDLVDTYEISPDGLTYTMKLRKGVMFHPPLSRPLTSADVMASWQRFTTDAKNTNATVYKPIVDSLTAPDDSTIVFKLKAPYAPFLNKLANPQYLWIMSKDVVDGKVDPSQKMIGTGPWIFDSATPTAFTWKKNPDYFLKGLPYADGVVLNIIPDTATREAQFQAGKLDFIDVPVADVDAIKKGAAKANVINYVGNLLAFLFFTNVSAPDSPFKDVRMRHAASLALDRAGLLDLVYSGQGAWSNLINPGLGKWHLDPQGKDIGDAGKWFKHDPKQAKQLITEAGHADTQFKYIYPNNAYGDVYNSASDAIRGMLSDAGFKLQVLTVDYQKDYIRTARAKGLATGRVIARHALKNTFIPVVTIIGLQVPVLVGGSVVLEQIFSLPGMGFYLLGAIAQRDFTVIQGVVVISASLVIISNLLVDLTYSLLDPRIRTA